jgi:hypothetical protein
MNIYFFSLVNICIINVTYERIFRNIIKKEKRKLCQKQILKGLEKEC